MVNDYHKTSMQAHSRTSLHNKAHPDSPGARHDLQLDNMPNMRASEPSDSTNARKTPRYSNRLLEDIEWGDPVLNLWWAVIRQAAWDVWRGLIHWAWDAIEFFKHTGVWLCQELFKLDPVETRRAVVGLVGYRDNADLLTLYRNR